VRLMCVWAYSAFIVVSGRARRPLGVPSNDDLSQFDAL